MVILVTAPAFNLTALTVVSPNGGENWTIGCPYSIQWLANSNTGTVKIELFNNNVFSLTIASQVAPGMTSYSWVPPVSLVPGNGYKVKITSLTSAADFDFSDASFAINLGTIGVVSPNGGEMLQPGSTFLITWTDNICDNVRIELWKGGVYNSVITQSTPSNGSFAWAIPATIVPGNDYKVKIMSISTVAGTTSQVFDFSDANFSIGLSALTVVAPNGGENWIIGCPYAIQWITTAAAGTVKIELYKNNAFCLTICSQVPAGMTTYTWIPPVTLIPGNTYKIKISSLTSTAVFDYSDANFTISQGTLTVVSPNGGETWLKGSAHQILWTDNICDNVRIELWKGGVYNSLISASTPSNGSFTWAIPNSSTLVPGNDYKVKIMSVLANTGAASQVYDFSDANFTIGAATLTVITPNGGENWYIGGTYPITWIDAVAQSVRIELWKGGVFNSLISNSANGPYNWTIPAAIAPGTDYKVKVISLTATGSYDFSDNNFTISQGSFITVISPNGGEQWTKGTTRIITWQDNIQWDVRIELCKGGAYHSLINASTPSNGSCYWAIPVTLPSGTDYKVKISALSNAGSTLFDFSDNNFSIIGPTQVPYATPYGVIRIYPNPVNSLLHVQFEEGIASQVVVDILDFNGDLKLHQVTDGVNANQVVDLNTSGLPEGNYIVRVKKEASVILRNNLFIRH